MSELQKLKVVRDDGSVVTETIHRSLDDTKICEVHLVEGELRYYGLSQSPGAVVVGNLSFTLSKNLFVDGGPAYQPAIAYGIRYREPSSRRTQTGWFRGTHEDPYQEEIPREEVASLLLVDVKDLIRWENATDSEAEEDSRADYGDY